MHVYALDGQTGAKKWGFKTQGKVRSTPSIGADGLVYFGSEDKKLYALDAETGKRKWAFGTAGKVESSPAIGQDGIIYVGSWDKKVYAVYGGGLGLASRAWPMFGQGPRRTRLFDLSRIKYPYLFLGD